MQPLIFLFFVLSYFIYIFLTLEYMKVDMFKCI